MLSKKSKTLPTSFAALFWIPVRAATFLTERSPLISGRDRAAALLVCVLLCLGPVIPRLQVRTFERGHLKVVLQSLIIIWWIRILQKDNGKFGLGQGVSNNAPPPPVSACIAKATLPRVAQNMEHNFGVQFNIPDKTILYSRGAVRSSAHLGPTQLSLPSKRPPLY